MDHSGGLVSLRGFWEYGKKIWKKFASRALSQAELFFKK